MPARYYICGRSGSGVVTRPRAPLGSAGNDAYRPEIVDEDSVRGFAANQELEAGMPPVPQPRFIVALVDPTGSLHAALAYDATTNPTGYDWLEVADDGTVSVHAA